MARKLNNPRLGSSRGGRAFYLTEMMFTVMLLAVFMLLATYAFSDIFKMMTSSQKIIADSQRLDGIIARLRSDVWNAQSILVAEDQSRVTLTSMAQGRNAQTIRWSFDRDGQLQRVNEWAVEGSAKNTQTISRWNSLSTLKFIPGRSTLTVELTELKRGRREPDQPPQTLAFTSQVLLGRNAE